MSITRSLLMTGVLILAACGGHPSGWSPDPGRRVAVGDARITNREAVIPPQCYTRTEGRFNPCYTCHQSYHGARPPRVNLMHDGYLQGVYAFSAQGLSNHWRNLFVDRRAALAAIRDDFMCAWVREDNYRGLRERLAGDPEWQGFVPDLQNYAAGAAAFDAQGFARDGSGWVAFNYKPFPSTFWPTNGAYDDVLIRLPERFRSVEGRVSRDIYLLNLSIVEAAIKDLEQIDVPAVNERELGLDLDGDGALEEAVRTLRRPAHYLGDAAEVPVARELYPAGTEFLHAVRYLDVNAVGEVVPAARFKELRYMKKIRFLSPAQLASITGNEYQEKLEGKLPGYANHADRGLDNGRGWQVLGFIEDARGELRRQSYEEQVFCMGCHATIGTTIDSTFSLPRKRTGAAGWGYINLRGMPDAPNRGETAGEILTYLKRVGGGSEFRENPEMHKRWFRTDGSVDEAAVRAADVAALILPSPERAWRLNKAYYAIVREQSFIHGRDAVPAPAENVYREIDPERAPPLAQEHRIEGWDIRLDWSAVTKTSP